MCWGHLVLLLWMPKDSRGLEGEGSLGIGDPVLAPCWRMLEPPLGFALGEVSALFIHNYL